MAYKVFWQIPQQVLYHKLEGDLSLDDFSQINQVIWDHLGEETTYQHTALLIDISRPGRTPQDFAALRASQTYMLRNDLKFILVVGSNKLMRLMMLLTFNLSKPGVRFFDDLEQGLGMAQRLISASSR